MNTWMNEFEILDTCFITVIMLLLLLFCYLPLFMDISGEEKKTDLKVIQVLMFLSFYFFLGKLIETIDHQNDDDFHGRRFLMSFCCYCFICLIDQFSG